MPRGHDCLMNSLKSCGWILINPASQILLLKNSKRNDWGLPKGHTEKGENELQTALRELEEETGIAENQISTDTHFRKEITYNVFKKNGSCVHKTALYFRARCDTPSVTLSREHNAWEWSTRPQIICRITYNSLRHLILEALDG